MSNKDNVIMIVRWGEQRREIEINSAYDIGDIEKAIGINYQLQRMDELHEYQIQYYDSGYQKFMDLYPRSLNAFQRHLHKLSAHDAPPKSTPAWVLKMAPRAVRSRRRSIHESLADDTYNYQQENDSQEFLQAEQPIAVEYSSLPAESSTIIDLGNICAVETEVPSDSTPKNPDEDEKAAAQLALRLSPSTIIQAQVMITSDHPYGLSFGSRLTDHQRQQYAREMTRERSSKKSTPAGVLLHACPKPEETLGTTKSYPIVHFQIPNEKHDQEWYLVFHIVTEADKNNAHYLHASKGIHLCSSRHEKQYGAIGDTELVNPCVVRLDAEKLRNGKFQILMKVCNRKDLPRLKAEHLRELSQRKNLPQTYQELTLSSTETTCSLNLSNEKYHLSCALMCEEIIYDQCMSNITMAVSGQKSNDNDQTRDKQSKKKKITR